MMKKFLDYPVVMLDVYGRERHPEQTTGEFRDEESYAARRDRADLMMRTYQYVPDGIPPANRHILIDVDFLNLMDRTGSSSGTVVTSQWGQRPQLHVILDLKGKIIHTATWENVQQVDEVLSKIFGVAPGY